MFQNHPALSACVCAWALGGSTALQRARFTRSDSATSFSAF
jgi:hypothetical protein